MGGLATETSIQSLARTNRKGFRSQEETKARRHKRGDSAPCTQDPLFPLLQGAEATGALTHGSGFNIRVEESNDYVDEDSQVEGNASPESHSAGEPVHQRHACGERRQTHISANLVPAGKAVTSQTPKLSSAQPVRPSLHAIDKSFLLISLTGTQVQNVSAHILCFLGPLTSLGTLESDWLHSSLHLPPCLPHLISSRLSKQQCLCVCNLILCPRGDTASNFPSILETCFLLNS